jgi:trehalose 6-phosphate synthase
MIHESFDRLVVVSNRLPVVLKWEHERWSVRAGAGGLVTALAPVLSRNGGVWMGWPGTSEQADVHQPLKEFSDSQGYLLHPVILNAKDVHGYYYGFSNEVLWPLLHGFHTHCNFKLDYWEKYQKVNNRFAQEILQVTTENDYVWVHDYHLMCVAREINRGLSHRKCGFFLHIPFPGPEIFLKLPWRRAVLGSLLEYDLIGFRPFRICAISFVA